MTTNLRCDSDANFIRLAQEGNAAAFASLFESHKAQIYSFCLGMTGDASRAESFTQQAFLQVFRKLASFHGEVAFSTWLRRVAAATVLLETRRKPGMDSSVATAVSNTGRMLVVKPQIPSPGDLAESANVPA